MPSEFLANWCHRKGVRLLSKVFFTFSGHPFFLLPSLQLKMCLYEQFGLKILFLYSLTRYVSVQIPDVCYNTAYSRVWPTMCAACCILAHRGVQVVPCRPSHVLAYHILAHNSCQTTLSECKWFLKMLSLASPSTAIGSAQIGICGRGPVELLSAQYCQLLKKL